MTTTLEAQAIPVPPAATEGTESATATVTEVPSKPIHTLILDAGPLIKNDPPVSTLLAQAHELYTIPSVLETEIRDAATRARVETTLVPFLKLRNPRPASIAFVRDFARRTGDLDVLSRPDLALLALAYEIECERNGGDWRLRKTPGQKGLNGQAPGTVDNTAEEQAEARESTQQQGGGETSIENPQSVTPNLEEPREQTVQEGLSHQLDSLKLVEPEPSSNDALPEEPKPAATEDMQEQEEEEVEGGIADEGDDDDEGWITPSNLKKHQEKDQYAAPSQPAHQQFLQVALLTSDYAMQNVLLRMNLNLVSPALARITQVKTWVLRCHGCFQVTRDTAKQFCPRCGQPTLTRVSASTDQATGAFTLHLKRNFQWNNRGNVYSVPKPAPGSASGKLRKDAGGGGGKNGWGRDLVFAEDQKEYVKKREEQRKAASASRDLMDEDYLPSILSGDRKGGPGRIRVGAGRNVNAKKRR